MREERRSTVTEKITAAAAVASAAAQAKIAVEAAKTRQAMEDMHEAIEIAAERQEHIQLAMASEQAENNFRNTVLATLPLLKTEKDRIQFLTEQFVPKLKNTEDDIVLFPLQWLILSDKKNKSIETFLESSAGDKLKKILAEGKSLVGRRDDWDARVSERDELELYERNGG